MVQCCWIWLVCIVWQLEWTSTWQLGGAIRDALRGCQQCSIGNWWSRTGLQTLFECHERGCGAAAYFDPGEHLYPGEDAGMRGQRGASNRWQKVAGEGARAAPEETQLPEEYGEAHRGKAEMDQQGDEAHRGRGGGGHAGKYVRVRKDTLRVAFEEIKKLRADLVQEGESMDKNRSHVLSPGELGERAKIKPEKGNRIETKGWSNDTRNDGGDRQLVFWNRKESRWNFLAKEENPRGGRERIHQERHQDVRRGHGRIGWLPVIVKVQSWILQALSKWDSFAERKRDGTVRKYDRLCDSKC